MKEATKVVRKGLEAACKDFSDRIKPLGFIRSRKMFWTRRHPHTADFIHLHRSGSSYGAPLNYSVDIKVELGIRVLNDEFKALCVNGPLIGPDVLREGRYHLRFNAKTGSTYERCIDDLTRVVDEQAEQWFQRFADVDQLQHAPDSPLTKRSKDLLNAALEGPANPDNLAVSFRLLGIKGK